MFQDSTYPCYSPYYSKDSSSIFFVFFAGWSLPVNAKVAQGSVCGPLLSFVSIHSVEDLIWFDAFKFYLHAEGWQIVSPAWTFSLKACFAYFHLPIQTSTWSSTRQCRFNVKPEFLIFSWQFAPLTVFLSSVEKLLGQKLWSHSFFFFYIPVLFFFIFNFILFLTLQYCIGFAKYQNESASWLFLSDCLLNLSANAISSAFKMYPKSDHFSPPPLLPFWFQNLSIAT